MAELFTVVLPAPRPTGDTLKLLETVDPLRKRINEDDQYVYRALEFIDSKDKTPFYVWLNELEEEDASTVLLDVGIEVDEGGSAVRAVEANFLSVGEKTQPGNVSESAKSLLFKVAAKTIYRAIEDIGTVYYNDKKGNPVEVTLEDERGTGIFWDGEFNVNVVNLAAGPQPLFVSGGWGSPDDTAPTDCFGSMVFLEWIGLFDLPFQIELS